MYRNNAHGDEHSGRRRARPRQAGLLAAALACLALLAAACSSSPSSGTGAAPASGSARHSELAFSRCMRAHGIKAFPDPNPQGGISLNTEQGTGIAPKSPQFKAAFHACQPLLPPNSPLSPTQQAAARAQALKFAQCMRAHGISDFPDPNGQGEIAIQPKQGSDLDPNNPRFRAANQACQHYKPGGPGASQSTSGGGGGS